MASRAWSAVHSSAYAAWPVALLHGAGMGSDASTGWLIGVEVACIAAFAAAVALRLVNVQPRDAKTLAPPPRARAAR